MFTVRPAFPRPVYFLGAFAAVVLIGIKLWGFASLANRGAPDAGRAHSPQILALEIPK